MDRVIRSKVLVLCTNAPLKSGIELDTKIRGCCCCWGGLCWREGEDTGRATWLPMQRAYVPKDGISEKPASEWKEASDF